MSDIIDNTLRTLRPDGDATAMPQPEADADKTIVASRDMTVSQATATDVAAEDRTLRPDNQQGDEAMQPQKEAFLLKGEQYEMVKCLSDNSGEAQIFQVTRDGREYVLKVYYPNFDINKKLFQVIRNFQFEMIVKLFDYGKTYVDGKHRYYELMEYLRGGTLQEYALGGDFNRFRRIALQAAAALAYCHQNNILHKDIKPSNFFFRDEEHTELVLGDFGISSLLEQDGKAYRTTQARTPIYAAPEMYADVIDGVVEITPAADYYSLGITLFALWLGENPMSSNERVMMRQKNEGRLPRLNELPDRVKMIVQGLTAVNPASRWKYDEVERWFLGEDVPIDISSPFLRYKSFIVDPDRNLVADNVHELIPLLLDNEQLAVNYLYTGRITSWLESCGNTKLSTIVKDVVINKYPVDKKAGLMASVYLMEPTYPYHDIQGVVCDDVHGIALSLLSYQERYAMLLQNPNDSLFLWLESHTKADVDRLRSYFTPDADAHVAIMRLVYEIDTDIPFLSNHPSSNIHEIVRSFGKAVPTDDDWHSLVDGRLLSWMYSHEDVIACESLRILTQDQEYSQTLAYKVLYNMDREAAYDLCDAKTPVAVGELIAKRLMHAEHASAEELASDMQDIVDPEGRFYYFAQLHGWNEQIAEATRCFDLKSEENTERMGAYDLRTALYRFCRVLGATPAYLMPDGTKLADGRNLPEGKAASAVRNEIRMGAFPQWLSVYYHEDPTRSFEEEFSYECELEEWVLTLGRYDSQQMYYKRFVKAREETTERINSVRKLWKNAKAREKFWRYAFYGVSAVLILLVLIFGVPDRTYLLAHPHLCIMLPVGAMTGIIVGVRAFFRGFGALMSVCWGLLGLLSALIPIHLLKFVDAHIPSLFSVTIVLLILLYMLVCHLTDFRRDSKTNVGLIKEVLSADDINTSLLEPLYYTFKVKSHRFKSSKFGVLDDVNDQVRSISGESVLHYILWFTMMTILVLEFVAFSPQLLNVPNPNMGSVSVSGVIDQLEKDVE